MIRFSLPLLAVIAALSAIVAIGDGHQPANAATSAIVFREPAFGLPHIYADTDLELVREYGREVAKDRLGQLIFLGRVGRGTLFQAFGALDPGTFGDDVGVRANGYTSSELNGMYDKLPTDIKTLLLEYAKGVNDTIEEVYAGNEPKPAEVALLQLLGLGDDLFGNATNISDQADPNYLAPGGADPLRPNGGFQYTPEMVMAVAVLQVRNFGSENFGEVSRLNELNSLVAKYGATIGSEIWDDLNFLTDPLAPVSIPDATAPGFGGPLSQRQAAPQPDYAGMAGALPGNNSGDLIDPDANVDPHREEFARSLGAWPALGSYAWMIDGDRSASGNPYVGGFPQTGIQTPSIMHFVETRSAEGADHRIEARGMAFAGAPAILIGETDSVAWTSTTAQLKNEDFYLDAAVLENADAIRYNDEGTPATISGRTELITATNGSTTPITIWRTHERVSNGGSRTVSSFQGDAGGTADSATATSLTDAGKFAAGFAAGYVAIVEGTGAGQIRSVLSSTNDTLTLGGGDAWTTTPDATSEYVAVQSGNDIVITSRERAYWLEESTAAHGFSLFQRAEDVLDIRAGARLIPTTHNFISADNKAFNGTGTNIGAGAGNTGFYSTGFSRVRQGGTPTDTRLPLDGTVANELVVVSGTVGSAAAGTLTDTAAFTAADYSAPALNFRLDNPTLKGSEYIVTITGGDGYKQTRRIASNTNDTLTLEEDWGLAPSAGDLYEIYEIVAMPEAINPPQGYTSNWNNKAATADDGRLFGRQQRNIFILERLAADSTWTRDEQRQLNMDVSGLDSKGAFGRYLIPRLRLAVDGVGNGSNPAVDTTLAALEAHIGSPFFGRGFVDPVNDTLIAGELVFLEDLIDELYTDIYTDEFSGTSVSVSGNSKDIRLDIIQHAIDSAAGGPAGAYGQAYSGDYFNGSDWRVVVRDALSAVATANGGIPADIARPDSTYIHPLSAIYPQLVFDTTPIGNRGHYEQIVEVGPTVLGEMIFPLGQSGFADTDGNPDFHMTSLHKTWAEWRFVPMLHVAEDLATDPDGDVDNDGVVDAFERWYFGSNAPLATDDFDSDGLNLLGEYLTGNDPTNADTDVDTVSDGADDEDSDGCTNAAEVGTDETLGGLRNPLNAWDFYDVETISGPGKDGVVDLLFDILGVINHYQPTAGGAPPYDANYDRGPSAGPNAWNMTRPDGVIDLLNDILGVVLQGNHTCT